MNEKELIKDVVYRFYEKATGDFLIGHHFRKIQEFQGEDILKPPMEAFASHLPIIERFWRMQLLGEKLQENERPFNLIKKHEYLKIRQGELGRWVVLFKETLSELEKEQSESSELIKEWEKRIDLFESIFKKSPILLGNHL